MNLYELAIILSATDQASQTLNKVTGAMNKVSAAGAQMQQFGQKLQTQGALMQGTADQINGYLDALTAPADKLEDTLAKVSTVIEPMNGEVGDALDEVKQSAIEWQNAHTDSADEFVDTTYNMISAGLDHQAAIEGTKVAMQVATATFGDSAQAAQLVATLYNNMGDKTADLQTEMTRLGDVVTKTQQTFQFENLNQLNEGLKYGVPVALQYGMSLEELSTVIGALNSAGITGSQAGTSFAATMRVMNKASEDLGFEIARTADGNLDFIKTVANIEDKFGTLEEMSPEVQQAMQDAFGAEGWMGLSLLIGNSEDLATNLDKVSDSAGAAADATAKIEATKTGGIEIMKNNFESLGIAIADGLGPAIQELTPKVIEMIGEVQKWVEQNPELVNTLVTIVAVGGGILAVVAPVMMAVGAFTMLGGYAVSAIGAIWSAGTWLVTTLAPMLWTLTVAAANFAMVLLANPITWIVLAIVAAVALLYVYWDPIVEFFTGIWNSIKQAFDQGFLQGVIKVLELFNPLSWVMKAFNAISEYLFGINLYDAGAKVLNTLAEGMKSMLSVPYDLMVEAVSKVRDLLPFSPAKRGPLRDLNKIRMIETIAESINPDPLANAMEAAVAVAATTAPVPISPELLPAVPAVVGGDDVVSAQGGGAAPQMTVNLNIGGNADKETVRQLEDLFRDNGRLLYALMKQQGKLEDRRKF